MKMDRECAIELYAVNKILKDRLTEMRVKGKITLAELRRISGVSESKITEWLAGKQPLVMYSTIWRIAKVLGIKLTIK